MDNSQAIMESLKEPLSKSDILEQLAGSFFLAILTLPFFYIAFFINLLKEIKLVLLDMFCVSVSKELYVELDEVEKKDKIVDIYFIGVVIITVALFIATSFLA